MSVSLSSDVLAKVRQIHIRTRRAVNELMGGEYLSAFKGQGMEFDEVREYQPGDDVRSIDWNVTARTGVPYIKRFVEERELTILLVVDVSASVFFGTTDISKRDAMAEVGALLAFTAMLNNDKVGLILFDQHIQKFIPPVKGKSQVLRVIQEILTARSSPSSQGGTDITQTLDHLNQIQKKRAVVFLISDFLAKDFSQALSRTSRRHDLICVSLHDRNERQMLPWGLVRWRDAETGEEQLLDCNHPKVRQAIAQDVTGWQRALQDQCRKSGCELIDLVAGEDLVKPLLKFFHQRERRLSHYA